MWDCMGLGSMSYVGLGQHEPLDGAVLLHVSLRKHFKEKPRKNIPLAVWRFCLILCVTGTCSVLGTPGKWSTFRNGNKHVPALNASQLGVFSSEFGFSQTCLYFESRKRLIFVLFRLFFVRKK